MAYVTGTANSMTDLLTALTNALTANGYTQSASCFGNGNVNVSLQVLNVSSYSTRTMLSVQAGNGIGGGTLTDPAPQASGIGAMGYSDGDGMTFPATYFLHINNDPDEVYLVVNYSANFYQWLAFGRSPVVGLPGTGMWAGATLGLPPQGTKTGISNRFPGAIFINVNTGGGGNNDAVAGALFWEQRYAEIVIGNNDVSPTNAESCFHHGLDGGGWTNNLDAISSLHPLVARQPNAWNGEAALLPIQPYKVRPSSKVARVGELAHARYLRIDNFAPGEIITLGSDRWKAYPWYRKDAANGPGAYFADHSGTLGWAIRYDGP